MKSQIGLAVLALSGWLCFYWKIKTQIHPAVEKVVYRDKIVEVEKIKTRIEIRPDGTKIVEKSFSQIKERKLEKTKEILNNKIALKNSYSLGLSRELLKSTSVYELELGYRTLGPFWITGSIDTKKDVLLGIRFEF